jgi:hypothetical protein
MAAKAKAVPSGKLCPCNGTCGYALCCRFQAIGRKRARTPGARNVAKHGAGPDHQNGECAACCGEPDRARRKLPPAPVAGAVVAALAGGALAGGAVAAAAAKAVPAAGKAGPHPKHPGKAKAGGMPAAGPHAAAAPGPPHPPAGPPVAPAAPGPGVFAAAFAAAAAAPGHVPMAPPPGRPRFFDLASSASGDRDSDLASEISLVEAADPPADPGPADPGPADPGLPPDLGTTPSETGAGSGGPAADVGAAEPPRAAAQLVVPPCLVPLALCCQEKDPKALFTHMNDLADERGRPRSLVFALVNGLLALLSPTREVRWGRRRGDQLHTRRADDTEDGTEDRERAWIGGSTCREAVGPLLSVPTVVHTIARLLRHAHLQGIQEMLGKPVDGLRQRFANEMGGLWNTL